MVRNGTSNNIGAALARLAALTGKSATIDAALPRSSQAPVVFIVGTALSRRADELKSQLSRLGGEIGHTKRGRRGSLKGRKVPIKYRDRSGNTWAGRGAHPVWLREKIKAGAKLEDFAVQKTVASRKVSIKKRRRGKR